jgi:tetratricopeptide (TPR) repeat protein
MRVLCVILFYLLSVAGSMGQNVFRDLQSLEKRADRHLQERSYSKALELYRQALTKPSYTNQPGIRIKIATCYRHTGNYEEAEYWYREAIGKGLQMQRSDSMTFARILIHNHHYEDARRWMPSGENMPPESAHFRSYQSIIHLSPLYRDSFSYAVKPIEANSDYADYAPVYYKNGLLFVSDRPQSRLIQQINQQKEAGFSDLYFYREKAVGKRKLEKIKLDLNRTLHIGPSVVYDNGKKIMVTANIKNKGKSQLQLYTGEWNGKKNGWQNFRPAEFNNAHYSVGHPAFSRDGRTMYFVSDKAGGHGGTDLYVSYLTKDGWAEPENMGAPVNTEGDELFPFVSHSGRLYFASDGHGGLGGIDILYLDKNVSGQWEVFNPGYPVNSYADDFALVLDRTETNGYFSSDRKAEKKDDNIFQLYIKKIELRLKVLDEISQKQLGEPFLIQLSDKETGAVIVPEKGRPKETLLRFVLKPYHRYRLIVRKEDYKIYESEISTVDLDDVKFWDYTAVLKRKYEYYVNIKVRDAESENLMHKAAVFALNLSDKKMDSVGQVSQGEKDIRLDADSDYLLIALEGGLAGTVEVPKPPKRKVSSMKYFTIKGKPIEARQLRFVVRDSLNNPQTEKSYHIQNMITGEVLTASATAEGQLIFYLKGAWYYRIYFSDEEVEYYYDSLTGTTTHANYFFSR